LVAKAGPFDPLAEFTERWQYGPLVPFKSLMAGSYYRLERHLKVGAFYRLQYGARHDNDWFRDNERLWAWADTTRRPESVLILDATPRTELRFLPGGNWVGSVKLRFERNFFSAEDVLKVEPELAWFWMNGLDPRATVFLRYETELALNFGERTVWQRWWYAAMLWHARPWLSLGPSIALHDENWSTSSSFSSIAGPGRDYSVLHRAVVAGFSVVARLR